MKAKIKSKVEKKDKKDIKLKDKLENIKSDYFLEKICGYLKRNRTLKIFKCSKKNQKRLKLNINSYKNYSEIFSPIEIGLKIIKHEPNKLEQFLMENEKEEPKPIKFINIKEEEKEYFHIYLNEKKRRN